MTEPLFGPEPPPAQQHSDGPAQEPLSPDRRRTLRQRADIAAGRHPLTRGPLLADPARPGATCGLCVHRRPGRYPKCHAFGPTYLTRGAATDVRAWWPACQHYVSAYGDDDRTAARSTASETQ